MRAAASPVSACRKNACGICGSRADETRRTTFNAEPAELAELLVQRMSAGSACSALIVVRFFYGSTAVGRPEGLRYRSPPTVATRLLYKVSAGSALIVVRFFYGSTAVVFRCGTWPTRIC